jgi:hypothetical protein
MATLKVTVTRELVERGVKRDSRHCMIAEAIKEQNPHFSNISVDLASIRWTNPRTGKRYLCLTPEIAGELLVDFDQGHDIEPVVFNVRTVQVTPNRKKGRAAVRGRKQLDGQMVIKGGLPLPRGHLGGGSNVYEANKTAKREREKRATMPPAEGASNVVRSASRYRQYGRRLLKG